jgi:DNA-binding beta-propeller fold protein YncE
MLGLLQRGQPDSGTLLAQEREPPMAPGLDGGTDWLNTEKPLKLEGLRGRVVLLDFWTLCCINCIHTLPDLAKLEAKYPGVLVVIGVHTPKFPHEKKTESIRKAVLRYEVQHPVVNDAEAIIWRRYRPFGVSAWPTLVLIDPEGRYYGRVSGEGVYDILDQHIGKLVKDYRAKKLLREKPLPFQLARLKEDGNRPLYFPGKVLADGEGKRLFIADSTHHRIVITDLEGRKIAVAGTGVEGKDDGPFARATFSDPQGMTLVGDTLYVADRKNHMIRALDLKAKTVKTVAGTGVQDRENRNRGGPGLKTGLNSPWDLLHHGKRIYVAMAGHHQIWTFDPERGRVDPYAGDGREDIKDGALNEAQFAQPSGLATDGKWLYVADCETSAVRAVPLDPTDEVKTIVGEGLFEFGDADGVGEKVRLQHALGVAYHKDGKLYVADTYNGKVKVIDPAKRACVTLELKRPEGEKGPVLNEPGGVSLAGEKLYVADTNSHRIRVIDLKTRAIATLRLEGVEPPAVAARAGKSAK